jgi:hypothetical protein
VVVNPNTPASLVRRGSLRFRCSALLWAVLFVLGTAGEAGAARECPHHQGGEHGGGDSYGGPTGAGAGGPAAGDDAVLDPTTVGHPHRPEGDAHGPAGRDPERRASAHPHHDTHAAAGATPEPGGPHHGSHRCVCVGPCQAGGVHALAATETPSVGAAVQPVGESRAPRGSELLPSPPSHLLPYALPPPVAA